MSYRGPSFLVLALLLAGCTGSEPEPAMGPGGPAPDAPGSWPSWSDASGGDRAFWIHLDAADSSECSYQRAYTYQTGQSDYNVGSARFEDGRLVSWFGAGDGFDGADAKVAGAALPAGEGTPRSVVENGSFAVEGVVDVVLFLGDLVPGEPATMALDCTGDVEATLRVSDEVLWRSRADVLGTEGATAQAGVGATIEGNVSIDVAGARTFVGLVASSGQVGSYFLEAPDERLDWIATRPDQTYRFSYEGGAGSYELRAGPAVATGVLGFFLASFDL